MMARMGCSVVDAHELRFTSQLVSCPGYSRYEARACHITRPSAGLMRSGVARLGRLAKEKGRPMAALNSMTVDQAAINAAFDFRRYAVKPMPAKPRTSMAQVEGSGTPDTGGDDL
nr:hypothetical protein [Bradyrhizobium algeriense]